LVLVFQPDQEATGQARRKPSLHDAFAGTQSSNSWKITLDLSTALGEYSGLEDTPQKTTTLALNLFVK